MPDYLVSLFKGCATGQQQHSTSSGSETGVSSELNERGPLSYIAGYVLSILKKLINNSRGKYKRNECLINVCKSDTDLS